MKLVQDKEDVLVILGMIAPALAVVSIVLIPLALDYTWSSVICRDTLIHGKRYEPPKPRFSEEYWVIFEYGDQPVSKEVDRTTYLYVVEGTSVPIIMRIGGWSGRMLSARLKLGGCE